MKDNNEIKKKSNEEDLNNKKSKKFSLAIDYSKFQQKFKNNNNKENINKDSNNIINEEKPSLKSEEKIKNDSSKKQNNLEQFLNISGILDESKLSLMENQINIIDNENINDDEINKMKYNVPNYLNDLPENNKEQELLLSINYNKLIKSNINNQKLNNLNDDYNKKRERSYEENSKKSKTVFNTSKKKNKYAKFLNDRKKEETDKNRYVKNYSNDKNNLNNRLNKKEKINSYAKMIKNNNNVINTKKPNENNSKENNSFLLFNGVNYNHNKSNFSEISYNALSTATGDLTDNSKTRNKTKNNKKSNMMYSNFLQTNNLKSYHNKNKSYDLEDIKENNNDNLILYSYSGKKNTVNNTIKSNIFNSKTFRQTKNNNTKINEDTVTLLNNMKIKHKNQENKYKNQQKDMKNEIKILKEKLKELSVNETLYQVEIEKLKRNNNKNENKQKKLNNVNNKEEKNSNQKYFGQKLDNIIQKYNKQNDNNINKNEQLLNIFNLNKDILDGEDIYEENDDNNYEEVLNNYPRLRKFIQILAKKYKNEKEYRMRLEEKTIEIFSNDLKKINCLEKKIKKYEGNKHFRVNSSLNYSYDNDLSEENVTKNSYKSCDKSL